MERAWLGLLCRSEYLGRAHLSGRLWERLFLLLASSVRRDTRLAGVHISSRLESLQLSGQLPPTFDQFSTRDHLLGPLQWHLSEAQVCICFSELLYTSDTGERYIYISQQLSVTAGSCERSPSGMVTVDTQPGNRADVASMHLHPPASKWQAIESSCLSVSLESLPTPPNSFNSQM